MLGINVPDVFNALQVYLGSAYVNDFNLFGRTFRVTAQADADYRLDTEDVLKIRVRNYQRRYRAARLVHHRARHLRPVPRAALQPLSGGRARRRAPRPAFRKARPSRSWRSSRPRRCREGFSYEWTDARLPADQRAGNTAIFAFVLAVVFVFLVLAAQYESLTLAARGHPDRADVPGRRDHRRHPARAGQQYPHPGRLHGADRPCRQERDPDRRVRASSRIRAATAGRRRSRPRGCGCVRS